MITEVGILLRVQHFQQRRRGITAPVCPYFVNLVEHKDGVARTGAAQRLHNPARHRADVGAAVAADLRFIAHATKGHASKFTAQCARDRLGEGGLAHAWGTDKTEDRAAAGVLIALV